MKQEQYDLILPEEVKSTNNSDIENKIFQLWNEQRIVVHSKLNADMKKAIKKAMESYSIEKITSSIRQKSRRWISISPFFRFFGNFTKCENKN